MAHPAPTTDIVPALSIIITLMVIFRTVFSGYTNAEWQRDSSYGCDFFVRFTDVVERLPQDVYVVVTAPRDRALPAYFEDVFRLTATHAMLYFEGPYVPESYDYGRMGHTGYLIVTDSRADLTADGVSVAWSLTVTESLHSRSPLPKFAPLDHTLLIKYDPYRELTILSAPEHLEGLVIRPEGGATSRASSLVRHLCDWDQKTSATLKHLEQSQPTAAVTCSNGDVTIYQINGAARSIAFQVSKADLDKISQHPATNTFITQANNIRLYRLTSGELQINAPASSPQQGDYVYIWGGCSK